MSKKYNNAIIYGDSVARGVIYDEIKNRYALSKSSAARLVGDVLDIEIINRSRMGMTIGEGLEMVESDIEKGIVADVAIIEFGGNDCDFNWEEISNAPNELHLPKTETKTFEIKLKSIISKIKSSGMTPILCTLPPINAESYFDFISRNGLSKENILSWLGDKNHIYRFHERYSLLVSRIAAECGCKLLDIRAAFLDTWNHTKLLCLDGIHPTDEGQRFIGNAILQII